MLDIGGDGDHFIGADFDSFAFYFKTTHTAHNSSHLLANMGMARHVIALLDDGLADHDLAVPGEFGNKFIVDLFCGYIVPLVDFIFLLLIGLPTMNRRCAFVPSR